jgi:hypothetical protein
MWRCGRLQGIRESRPLSAPHHSCRPGSTRGAGLDQTWPGEVKAGFENLGENETVPCEMLVQSQESRVNKSLRSSPFIIHAKRGPDMVATKDDWRFSVPAKHAGKTSGKQESSTFSDSRGFN